MSTHDEGREAATEIVDTKRAHELEAGDVVWVDSIGWAEFLREDPQTREDVFDITARPLDDFEPRTLSDDDETCGHRFMRDDKVLVRRPVSSPGDEGRDGEALTDLNNLLVDAYALVRGDGSQISTLLDRAIMAFDRLTATPVTSPKGPEDLHARLLDVLEGVLQAYCDDSDDVANIVQRFSDALPSTAALRPDRSDVLAELREWADERAATRSGRAQAAYRSMLSEIDRLAASTPTPGGERCRVCNGSRRDTITASNGGVGEVVPCWACRDTTPTPPRPRTGYEQASRLVESYALGVEMDLPSVMDRVAKLLAPASPEQGEGEA